MRRIPVIVMTSDSANSDSLAGSSDDCEYYSSSTDISGQLYSSPSDLSEAETDSPGIDEDSCAEDTLSGILHLTTVYIMLTILLT